MQILVTVYVYVNDFLCILEIMSPKLLLSVVIEL